MTDTWRSYAATYQGTPERDGSSSCRARPAPGDPTGLIADVAEELEHRVRTQVRGNAGSNVELRVHLDEVEAHDVAMLGEGGKGVAQLGVGHAVGLG